MPAIRRPYNIARHNLLETDVIDANAVISFAISPNEKDLLFLQYMFDDANWRLYKARTYREAMLRAYATLLGQCEGCSDRSGSPRRIVREASCPGRVFKIDLLCGASSSHNKQA